MVAISGQHQGGDDHAHGKTQDDVHDGFGAPVGVSLALGLAHAGAAGWLRNGLFKRLAIHTVPTLHFQFDRTTERAADLSALITKANAQRARDD